MGKGIIVGRKISGRRGNISVAAETIKTNN